MSNISKLPIVDSNLILFLMLNSGKNKFIPQTAIIYHYFGKLVKIGDC